MENTSHDTARKARGLLISILVCSAVCIFVEFVMFMSTQGSSLG